MKHVIVGRYGPDDHQHVSLAPGEVQTDLDFLSRPDRIGRGIGGALDDLHRLGLYPTETGLDLYLLAVLLYAADTRISRSSESEDNWTREIRLVLPVNDPEVWIGTTMQIQTMLAFLTGDRWVISFLPRPHGFAEMVKATPLLRSPANYTNLSLLSGGMDSLIGAIDELEEGSTPLFVSHAGDPATSAAQQACLDGIHDHFPRVKFDRFRVWLQFPKELVPGVENETSTRSRSFLFLAAAMLAGSGIGGASSLRVPENGLIALNVPLDPNRVGALSTRTTHPFYLARWRELVAALGIEIAIINPYWEFTKGEMVEHCRNHTLLAALLPKSMSCSSPTKGRYKKLGIQHCGFCLPCIIRRAAMLKGVAPIGADPTTYTLADLAESPLDTRKSDGKQVRSFQMAINRLKDDPDLAKYLILKPGPLSDEPENHSKLAGVYGRGMLEVGSLLESVIAEPR